MEGEVSMTPTSIPGDDTGLEPMVLENLTFEVRARASSHNTGLVAALGKVRFARERAFAHVEQMHGLCPIEFEEALKTVFETAETCIRHSLQVKAWPEYLAAGLPVPLHYDKV